MPNDSEILISISCRQETSGIFGNLKIVTGASASITDVGPVDAMLPVEVRSEVTATPFVPQDDSDQAVALLMRRQPQAQQFLAAMMTDGGEIEAPIHPLP